MKVKFLTLWGLVALLVGPWSTGAIAQDERAGTAAAEYLVLPLSARTASLGGTITGGIDNMSGVEALQANPAALMVNMGTGAQFSRMEYVADIGVNYLGIAQRFGNNNLALTVSFWDFGDIPLQTEQSPEISDLTYEANNFAIGLSLARQFTDRIAAGFTVKGLSERIDDMDASGVAIDAGMTYVVGESGLRFGVSLKNFGPAMSYGGNGLATSTPISSGSSGSVPTVVDVAEAELPSMLNFGASYTRQFAGDLNVTALTNFRSLAYDQDQYGFGLEADYQNLFFVRGGVQVSNDMDFTFYDMWNVGAGVNLAFSGVGITVDYAYRATQYFDGVNLFTVGLNL